MIKTGSNFCITGKWKPPTRSGQIERRQNVTEPPLFCEKIAAGWTNRVMPRFLSLVFGIRIVHVVDKTLISITKPKEKRDMNEQIESQAPKLLYDMINEAVDAISAANPDEPMTYSQIYDWVAEKYGPKNRNSMSCHIISESVNAPSRVHYGHKKPRIIDQPTPRDYLFSVGPGRVIKYDPEKHGVWSIRKDEETDRLLVEPVGIITGEPSQESTPSSAFALESHLRDYLARNLGSLLIDGKKLELVRTEYPTGVGPIDILAKDEEGNFYVFELKCSRGTDPALGQLLRYKGWLMANEAKDKKVFGIIVAEKIDRKLKYALNAVENVTLLEYEVNFQLKKPSEIEDDTQG